MDTNIDVISKFCHSKNPKLFITIFLLIVLNSLNFET